MKRLLAICACLAATTAHAQQQQSRIVYPPSKTITQIDDYFGRKIADPYRWMEDLNSADVTAWVKSQNEVTERYLAALPIRERFKSRLTELYDRVRVSVPFREAGKLFYNKNSGLQPQAVWMMRESTGGPERVVIDPNKLSPDGSVALTQFTPSPDGRHFAYGLSQG